MLASLAIDSLWTSARTLSIWLGRANLISSIGLAAKDWKEYQNRLSITVKILNNCRQKDIMKMRSYHPFAVTHVDQQIAKVIRNISIQLH